MDDTAIYDALTFISSSYVLCSSFIYIFLLKLDEVFCSHIWIGLISFREIIKFTQVDFHVLLDSLYAFIYTQGFFTILFSQLAFFLLTFSLSTALTGAVSFSALFVITF